MGWEWLSSPSGGKSFLLLPLYIHNDELGFIKPHVMVFCTLNPMPRKFIVLAELFTSQQDPPADASVTSRWERLSGSDVAYWFTGFLPIVFESSASTSSCLLLSSVHWEHHFNWQPLLCFGSFSCQFLILSVPDANTPKHTVNVIFWKEN